MECVLLSEAHTAARTADLALPGEKARSPLVAPHHTTTRVRTCGPVGVARKRAIKKKSKAEEGERWPTKRSAAGMDWLVCF